MKNVFIVISLLFLLSIPYKVYAQDEITVSISPSHDATVEFDSESKLGWESKLVIENNDTQKAFLIKFDLGSLLENAQISSAIFSLTQQSGEGASISLKAYKITSPWDEGTVTGVTKPSYDTSLTFGDMTIDTSSGKKTFPQDLSDLISWWISNPDQNYGLALIMDKADTYTHTFGSRESSNPPQLSVTYTLPDTEGPVISDIGVTKITTSTATITWKSNEAATSYVEYGTDTNYGRMTGNSDLTTDHTVILDSLLSETTYHIKVKSSDEYDNETVSSDKTFMTKSQVQTEEPEQQEQPDEVPSEQLEEPIPKADETISLDIEVPKGFNAVLEQDGETSYVKLVWDLIEDETVEGYKIYRSVGDTVSYQLLASLDSATSEYKDISVSSGNSYYYIIRSVKGEKESDDSNEVDIHVDGVEEDQPESTADFWRGFLIVNIVGLPIFVFFYIRYKRNARKVYSKKKSKRLSKKSK